MTTIGVSRWMFLLVLAHPGCPRQNLESRKMVVCVCVNILCTLSHMPKRMCQTFEWHWHYTKNVKQDKVQRRTQTATVGLCRQSDDHRRHASLREPTTYQKNPQPINETHNLSITPTTCHSNPQPINQTHNLSVKHTTPQPVNQTRNVLVKPTCLSNNHRIDVDWVKFYIPPHTAILRPSWILSRITRVSWHQKGKTRKVKPIWIYWSKR